MFRFRVGRSSVFVSNSPTPWRVLARYVPALLFTFVLSSLWGLSVPCPALAQSGGLVLTLRSYKTKTYAIAIPEFLDEGSSPSALGKQVARVIRNDLKLSGVFDVINPLSYLETAPKNGIDPGTFDFEPWRQVKAQVLLKGRVVPSGGGLRIMYRLYEIGTNQRILGEDFLLSASQRQNLRWYTHLISEKIYRKLTNEKGIFSTKVVCVRINTSGSQELWYMDFDGHSPKQLTQNGSINALPAWSPNGQYIAYTSWKDRNPDLYVLDRTTGVSRKISQYRGLNTGAAWSPDGSKIAFSASRSRANMDIYVVNANGSGLRQLTFAKSWERNLSPSWSPDGTQITFVSNRYASPQIFVMNADGSGQRQLTTRGRYNQAPKWSPRGDWILFTGRDETNKFDIFKVSPKDSSVVRLTQGAGNNTEASWSPNGRNIVFTSTRSGVAKLFLMSADGESSRDKIAKQITFLPGTFQTPSWSPAFYP